MAKIIKVKVQNMQSSRGTTVPNQFMIWTADGVYFQSYNTVIAFQDRKNQIYLDARDWNYSKTTSIYRNQFLGEDTKATERKIQAGIYKLADLNNR